MFDLINELPDYVEHGGIRYGIRTDFRVWMQLDGIFLRADMPPEKKMTELFKLCYTGVLPPDAETAVRLLVSFYCGGVEPEGRAARAGGPRAYDFVHDAGLIYAAFLEQYGIDLCRERLHWWQFLALFQGLSESSRMLQVMSWRVAEPSGIKNRAQREYVRRMKRLYRLPTPEGREKSDEALAEAVAEMIG